MRRRRAMASDAHRIHAHVMSLAPLLEQPFADVPVDGPLPASREPASGLKKTAPPSGHGFGAPSQDVHPTPYWS